MANDAKTKLDETTHRLQDQPATAQPFLSPAKDATATTSDALHSGPDAKRRNRR